MEHSDTKQLIGKIEGRLDSIEASLSEVRRMLVGNGQAGLLERQARTEENLDEAAKNIKSVSEYYKGMGKGLKESELHAKDKEKHTVRGLFLKRDVLLAVLVVFMLLHSVIPTEITIWSLVSRWLGF